MHEWVTIKELLKIEKNCIPKESQDGKIENVADSLWLSLFKDGTGKCKLPST
jgi:hypothetical protein